MTAGDLIIRPFEPGDEQGVLELFNTVFAEDDEGVRSLEHWRWEFAQNPAGRCVVLGVEPGGRVVAQYAVLPTRAVYRGKEVQCDQGIDSVVHADYRRGLRKDGAFLRTARYYFDTFGQPEYAAFGYGFPNKQAFRVGVKLLGYHPVHSPIETVARNLFQTDDDTEVGRDACPDGQVILLERFDARVDRLWERLRPSVQMGIARTSTYLDWRYVACPAKGYRSFALTEGDADGEFRALTVLRENWMGPPILAISEWMVEDADVGAAARLLAHAVAHARAAGQARVELWLRPGHPQRRIVLERGFFTEASPFHLCLVPYEPSLDAEWAREHWDFTIGDADIF